MSAALSVPPERAVAAPAGSIEAALLAIEARPRACRQADAAIAQAIGFDVERVAPDGRLLCRSAWQQAWQALPHFTALLDAAALLVPFRWSWGAGVRGGVPYAWCAAAPRIAAGVPFFEGSGTSPALALCRAGLFARRHLGASA